MFKKFWNYLRKPFIGVPMHRRVLRNNKGFLDIFGGAGGGKSKSTSTSLTERARPEFVGAEEFPETTGAREEWWNKLQQFGGQPGYGAIAPDWADIWQNAQKKVQQYFWGSPTDPGLAGKMKASLARRNVAEGPQSEAMISRLGATEGNILSSMATEQATKQSELAESGRLNYLTNLMSMSGMQMPGTWFSPWTKTSGSQQGSQSGWDVGAKLSGEDLAKAAKAITS